MERFCTTCGAPLGPTDQFCTSCGAPMNPEPAGKTRSQEKGFFYRLWHNHAFEAAAVKINQFTNYVYAVLGCILIILGFFWGYGWTVWGTVLGLIGVINLGYNRKLRQQRKYMPCPTCNHRMERGQAFCPICGTHIENPGQPYTVQDAGNEEAGCNAGTMNRKKIGMLIEVALLIGFVVFLANGGAGILRYGWDAAVGGPIYQIQNITLDEYGPQTMKELMDDNLRSPTWTSESIDEDASNVYVEGYMPIMGEDVRIRFYYEDQNDGTFEYSLNRIDLLDSQQTSSDVFDVMLFLELMYENAG